MASSPKFACLFFFFLFTTLVFSLQTQARDSQFFNKLTRDSNPTIRNPNTPKTNAQQQQEEEEPTFLPQTTGTGYGLYGHETGLDPPTTTIDTNNNNKKKKKNNDDNKIEIAHHHDQNNYATELKGLSVNGFTDGLSNNNNNNIRGERKYDYSNNYYEEGVGYNGGVEKQGVSDTRFMENGKYYYDAERNKLDDQYEYDRHHHSNYMSYPNNNRNNYYHREGYFGHFDHGNSNYGDEFYNTRFYRNGNSMQRGEYQNQMHEEREFNNYYP